MLIVGRATVTMKYTFINGLPPGMQKYIKLQKSESLEQMINVASEYINAHWGKVLESDREYSRRGDVFVAALKIIQRIAVLREKRRLKSGNNR